MSSKIRAGSKIANSRDHKTRVARKLYKRTANKVEWSILDLSGEPVYAHAHATLLTALDATSAAEPTVFVLVYDHTEYSRHTHIAQLGAWLHSLLVMYGRAQPSDREVMLAKSRRPPQGLQVKLVGVCHGGEELATSAHEHKINTVLSECMLTLQAYVETLHEERARLAVLLASSAHTSGGGGSAAKTGHDRAYLRSKLSHLDALLDVRRRVNLNGSPVLVAAACGKKDARCLTAELERISVRMGAAVPVT